MDDDKRIPYFFLGVGIGVAVGILFAPKSGEETRTLIRSKADESKDYLKRKSEESKDFLKRKSEEVREQAAEVVDKSKIAIQRQKEQLAAAVDAGKQAYRESIKEEPGLAAD
jgi:gas vesicle protein